MDASVTIKMTPSEHRAIVEALAERRDALVIEGDYRNEASKGLSTEERRDAARRATELALIVEKL